MIEVICALVVCIIGRFLCNEYQNKIEFLSNVGTFLYYTIGVLLFALIIVILVKVIRKLKG